jgi:hypothetical protein
MSLLSLLLAVTILQGSPGETQTVRQPQQADAGTPRHQPQRPAEPASQSATLDSIVSIERIRREIERQPIVTFRMPDPNQARFQVEIQGYRFDLKTSPQDFVIPRSLVPAPFGGVDHYEMTRLITPPQYWGSAPYTNGDLLKMSALAGAYGLAGALIKKGLDARAGAGQRRARDEVQQELEQIAAHNALVAAGLADDDAKKKEEEKKKAEKKK